jgi:hypothetical protein
MNLPGANLSDRRAHDRHPFRTAAQLVLADGRELPARTLDLGKGGTGVVVDVNLAVGTTLQVRMRLPARPSGSTSFEARATVANCTLAGSDGGFRVGLEFASLDAAALAALKGALPA